MNRRLLPAVFCISMVSFIVPAYSAGRLHPKAEERLSNLRPGEMLSVIVEMEEQSDLRNLPGLAKARHRRARVEAVVAELKAAAHRAQGPVLGMLQREVAAGAAHSLYQFWIFNGLAVTASERVIRSLAERPDVREVRLDFQIPRPVLSPADAIPSSGASEWNIERVRAPETWALGVDYNGSGTVVGSFDTGVDITHPDLSSRYRGNHSISWYDPYREHDEPYDFYGHGTHTVGTAVGGDFSGSCIGVAPGARWIAAKGWNDLGYATASAFHRIFEWFLAPGGDPDNVPDVVINSWVLDESGCDTEFLRDIEAWRAAGIFPAFASGNSGPEPGSVRVPGAYAESFTVGATDYYDQIAYFSGQGPSPCDQAVKPNISAPGDEITSAVPGGYAALSGTSMATPHVAGAVAVLRSIRPDATVEELEALLAAGAGDLGPAGPDNAYGAGLIDLYVTSQIMILGPDVPRVRVLATSANATEAGTNPGSFTLSRIGNTDSSLAVYFTVSGTALPGSDYISIPQSATFPPGSESVTVTVTPIDDSIVELDETVTLTLSYDPAYIVASPKSATIVIISDEVPPDLVLSTFTSPSSSGAGETITVGYTIRNDGGGAAEASLLYFLLSADGMADPADTLLGSTSIPALAAGTSESGSAGLTIPGGIATGLYYLFAKADGNEALIESNEANNVYGRSLQLGPDLIFLAVSIPSTTGAGMSMTVTDTVKNQGGGSAAPSIIGFYLSDDGTFDPADIPIGSRPVPSLAPAATNQGSTILTIPAGAPTGTAYIFVRADADETVAEIQENNNQVLRTIAIGPDLRVSALSVPSSGQGGASITVTDTVLNSGGGAADSSAVRFYLSPDGTLDPSDTVLGGRSVPALAPGASSSGSSILTLPANLATATYYLIAKADSTDAVAETYEANNTYSRTIQIGPDLVISAMSVPSTTGAGMSLTITDTVKNQGGGSADPSVIRFYLSDNATLDPADTLLGSRSVPALAPAATDSGSTSVTMPAAMPPGIAYIFARADADEVVTETQENNNQTYRSIAVGPDLRVSTFSVPPTGQAGGSITVSDTVQNSGGGAADPSVVQFYLSTDGAIDPSDALLGSRAVPALTPGASSSDSSVLTLPAPLAAATYYLIARADGTDAVVETYETNNTYSRTIQIGPDLVVSALSVPSTAGAGMSLTITDTVKNQGGSSADPSVIRFYLSDNGIFDPSDIPLGSRPVPALAPAAADTGSTVVAMPAAILPGIMYIFAAADADETVTEIHENNNQAYRSTTVGPDLRVSSFTVPSSGQGGASITVTDTVQNSGGGAADSSVVQFHLSTDGTIDPSDALLGGRSVPALAPGASSSGSSVLTLPAPLTAGTYYLIAKADGTEAVAETYETNNTNSRTILIGPDLVVSSMSVPLKGGAGMSLTISDTVKNQGGSSANASVVRFYLSDNGIFEPSDIPLGSRSVPSLAPAASNSGSTSVTIPADTVTATFYIIAQADAEGAITETQENNNQTLRNIAIGPDLRVYSFYVPYSSPSGAPITVTDTVLNNGGGAAGSSIVQFYLSTNPSIDPSDVMLGGRPIAALAPGATSPGSTALVIPAGTAAGTYYIIAQADSEDAVTETYETNNTYIRIIRIQ